MGKYAAAPPTAIVSPSDQIGQLLVRGQWHHQAGQLAEAENYYRKVLAIDPNDFDGLHLLGVRPASRLQRLGSTPYQSSDRFA